MIQGVESFRCQAFSTLIAPVDFQLKFGKHGLTIQGGAELLQKIID